MLGRKNFDLEWERMNDSILTATSDWRDTISLSTPFLDSFASLSAACENNRELLRQYFMQINNIPTMLLIGH